MTGSRSKTLNAQPEIPPQRSNELPDPMLWRKLLSGNREQITRAVEQLAAEGLTDEYAVLLLAARRRGVRRQRRLLGFVPLTTGYTERERRSALTALGLLWGAV